MGWKVPKLNQVISPTIKMPTWGDVEREVGGFIDRGSGGVSTGGGSTANGGTTGTAGPLQPGTQLPDGSVAPVGPQPGISLTQPPTGAPPAGQLPPSAGTMPTPPNPNVGNAPSLLPPAQPERNPTDLDTIRRELMEEAKRFRSGLPQYKREKYGIAAEQGREELNENLGLIRKSANSRGLLFSGLRQGAEAGSRAKTAAMLAQQKADINREAEDLASAKEYTAGTVGLAGYGDAIKRQDDLYQAQYERALQRRKELQGLGSGIGYGFGTYASYRNNRNGENE